MFEDSLIESSGRFTAQPKTMIQRVMFWAFVVITAFSILGSIFLVFTVGAVSLFASIPGVLVNLVCLRLIQIGYHKVILAYYGQFLLVGVLVLIPLLFTEALPKALSATLLVAPPPPPPPPPPPAAAPVHIVKQVQTDIINGQLRTPTKIPDKVQMIKEDEAPPPMMATGVVGGVPGGVPGGQMGGVLGSIISSSNAPVPKMNTPQRVRVSQGVTSGLLTRRVNPTYPALARTARIQGRVLLQAQISKSGDIQNLQVISGHPMLIQSALDAVKQWKYRPYYLNGEPVEVDTTIEVNFTLAGG